MKGLLKKGIFLSLGLLATRADAQEIQWRAITPVATSTSVVQTTATGVSLNRPVPVVADGQVPIFRPSLVNPASVVRGQSADEIPNLPVGTQLAFPASVVQNKPIPPRPIVPNVENLKPMPKSPDFVPPAPKVVGNEPLTIPQSTGQPLGGHNVQNNVWGGMSGTPGPEVSPFAGLGTDACDPSCNSCGSCSPLLGGDCGTCRSACATRRAWIGADYLMWFTKAQSVPPLLTQSAIGAVNPGVLGAAGTRVLLDDIDDDIRHGGRFYGGFYFPRNNNWGMDASYFFLGTERQSTSFFSNGNPILARPIVIPAGLPGAGESALFVGNGPAGFVNGSFTASSYSDLHGLDVNLRRKLWAGSNVCLDLLAGYRYIALEEGLSLVDNETRGGRNIIATDRFDTQNYFHGGQIGVAGEWHFAPRWSLSGAVKVAFGNVEQIVNINGTTQFVTAGTSSNAGGVLALASNIGRTERSNFAVVPEVGLKVGWDVTNHLRLHIGYDFLLLSDAVRPAEQIDRTVNPTLIPTELVPNPVAAAPLRPAVLFTRSDFWATGLNFGMMYHW